MAANPFMDWLGQNKVGIGNIVGDLGYGISQGGFDDGFKYAGQRTASMQQPRAEEAAREQAAAEARQQKNATADWLRQQGREDLASAIEMGSMTGSDAFKTHYDEIHAQAPAPPTTDDITEFQFARQNGFTGTFPEFMQSGKEGQNAPAGYQWNQDGTQSFIPGGPADPATLGANKPPTEAQVRASSLASVVNEEVKVLFGDPETGKTGTYGALGDLGQQIGQGAGSAIGAQGFTTSAEYQSAKTALETIAQTYLYVMSGQAAPEGEVKRVAASLTPLPGEGLASIAEKKRRIQTYIDAINQAATRDGVGADAAPADDPLNLRGGQ